MTKAASKPRLPALPMLLQRKIYKTGQTRGADDDVIFQNRVSRSSTVLIPYACWDACSVPQDGTDMYENGFIVLIPPEDYFASATFDRTLQERRLALGSNALVFYETRAQWTAHNPEALGWKPAKNRKSPLRGQYVARIPATTAKDGNKKIVRGFDATRKKGAGIRVYEYASTSTIAACRLQLEVLFWNCQDSETVAQANGMRHEDRAKRKDGVLAAAEKARLADLRRLEEARVVNADGRTICPLCLEELSADGFFSRMEQAEGRAVPDLTVTQINLFHIDEVRIGALNHRPYNVGWGHHHCNVVVRDTGIANTLTWMSGLLRRNIAQGHFVAEKSTI